MFALGRVHSHDRHFQDGGHGDIMPIAYHAYAVNVQCSAILLSMNIIMYIMNTTSVECS